MWSFANRRCARRVLLLGGAVLLVASCTGTTRAERAPGAEVASPGSTSSTTAPPAPWHVGITATVFWVGEPASSDNGGIANHASAWDDEWLVHYGGVDDPDVRRGAGLGFTPRENPFYVALPYNDFAEDGLRKPTASVRVPWAGSRPWAADESMVKNHWVEIRMGEAHVFAQWEDVGPYLEDDDAYVFGPARPANRVDSGAGIDLSPAVRDALGAGDVSTVDWRFVDRASVAAGPWTAVVTTTQITWR
jgi:hypothetical protein